MYDKQNKKRIPIQPNPKDPVLKRRLEDYIHGIFECAKMDILGAPVERLVYLSMRQVKKMAQYAAKGYYKKQEIRDQLWTVVLKTFGLSEDDQEHEALIHELKNKFEAAIEVGWEEPKTIEVSVECFSPSPLDAHVQQMRK